MRILIVLSLVLLAACSSQPPQTSSYLLRSEVPSTDGEQLAETSVALGGIEVAAYIRQPGLVLASGDGKIHAARNHVWAEPLQVSLRRFLANEISAAAGKDIGTSALPATATRINVTIDQLHGDGKGAAVLVAYWELEAGANVSSYQFAERQDLVSDGYDALVRAQEALLKRLAAAIARSLDTV